MLAYIDEAGQRSHTPKSSDHFVMSAAILLEEDLPRAQAFLARLRIDLNRQPGHHLSWKNLRSHSDRLHVSKSIAQQEWLTISAVVVCKKMIMQGVDYKEEKIAYLHTLRFVLERLSWLAREGDGLLTYHLAHVVRFKLSQLREYESSLRGNPYCRVAWNHMDPAGGSLGQPQESEMLQLGDLTASAIFRGFEPDKYGYTETRYLQELTPRFYRRGANLTSYGLKMHPWNETTKAAYPWVAAL
ncbi:DUF3800 domain-containing protein [Actinocorallia aurantiaca]